VVVVVKKQHGQQVAVLVSIVASECNYSGLYGLYAFKHFSLPVPMTSPRLVVWLLSSLCAFASTSCHQQRDPEPILSDLAQVSYAQTQCADKWGMAATSAQLETVATTYLAQQGINLVNAHAAKTGMEATCNACTCPTGLVLTGQVAYSQLAAIQAQGFTSK
jgi:hypothetical protein